MATPKAANAGPGVSEQNQGSVVVTHERGVRVWRPIVPAPVDVAVAPAQVSSAAGYDQTNYGTGYGTTYGNRYGSFGGAIPSFGLGTGSGLGGLGAQPTGGQFFGGTSARSFGAPLRGFKPSVNVKMDPRMIGLPMGPKPGMGQPGQPGMGGKPHLGMGKPIAPGGYQTGGGFGPHKIVIRGDFGPKMGGPRMGFGPRGGRPMGMGQPGMGGPGPYGGGPYGGGRPGMAPHGGGPKMVHGGGMGPRMMMGGPRMGGPRMAAGRRGGHR